MINIWIMINCHSYPSVGKGKAGSRAYGHMVFRTGPIPHDTNPKIGSVPFAIVAVGVGISS